MLQGWLDRQAVRLAADVVADDEGQSVSPADVVGRARRLWTLAHLRRHGVGGDAVNHALPIARALLDRHVDPIHGGYRWFVHPGTGIDHKLLYGQSVVILALAELALAEPAMAADAMADAEATLALVARPLTAGGAVAEFLDTRWQPLPLGVETVMGRAGTVTVGGQLHLLEAMAVLATAGGGTRSRDVGGRTADILQAWFLAGPGHPDRSSTDERGVPLDVPVSLGHKVEAAWILADAAGALGLADETPRARRWVNQALAVGFRHDGLNDDPVRGFRPGGEQRSWWVQAELLRALVEIDEGPGSSSRDVLRRLLGWLHRHQVDPRTGQAHQLMTHRGLVLVAGDGTTARTGYHDVRAYVAAAGLLQERPLGARTRPPPSADTPPGAQ